jgi:microcystin-dependent protein
MQPFLGQLLLASWGFTATGFLACNGQLLAINQWAALFSLIGTTYGGNGIQTFAIPNLQGRTPIGVSVSSGISWGQIGGTDSVTLNSSQVPPHTHTLNATAGANLTKPAGAAIAAGGGNIFTAAASLEALNPATIGNAGGSQPHENRQPYLVMNWLISTGGIFPSRS